MRVLQSTQDESSNNSCEDNSSCKKCLEHDGCRWCSGSRSIAGETCQVLEMECNNSVTGESYCPSGGIDVSTRFKHLRVVPVSHEGRLHVVWGSGV